MPIDLTWTAAGGASCCYALAQLLAGRTPTTPALASALDESASRLGELMESERVPTAPLLSHLTALTVTSTNLHDCARTALAKTVGRDFSERLTPTLAALLDEAQRAYFAAFPQLQRELELRGGPLRQLWEGRGPGLMAGIGRRTDRRVLVDAAAVALVQPFAGGGGFAHAASNTVAIEAVLTDSLPQLPETVRLAWLLSTLNSDLPEFVERLPPQRAEALVQVSMLPVVLEAAADVELIRTDDALPSLAAETWRVPLPAGRDSLERVCQWWELTRRTGQPWGESLEALDRLLTESD